MKNIPLINQIDDVLYFFEQHQHEELTRNNISKLVAENRLNVSEELLTSILGKLIKDGYVVRNDRVWQALGKAIAETTYNISFDGLIFNYEGGYKSLLFQKDRNYQLEKNQREMLKTQTEMVQEQARIMGEQMKIMDKQTSIQNSVKWLTVSIAIGTIIAGIYYIQQMLISIH